MASTETAIEMFVGGLVLDPNTQAPVVILKDETGQIALPIWIGIAEATSIASAIKQVTMARPLTHDLMYDIFGELGVMVQRVVITDLKDSTYYAELVLSIGEKMLVMDCRPSDAMAISLRASAPIYVAQAVLDQAKVSFSQQEGSSGEEGGNSSDESQEGDKEGEKRDEFITTSREKWSDLLAKLDPDDFKYKM